MPASDVKATLVTVGAVVSTLCADWVATALWVIVAVLPGISVMVPEFSASAFKEIANPSVSVSRAATVYVNTRVLVPEPDEYRATLLVRPAMGICGNPVTVTVSEKATLILTMSPVL